MQGKFACSTAGRRQLQGLRHKMQGDGRRRSVVSVAVSAPNKPVSTSITEGQTDVWTVTFRVHNAVNSVPLKIQCVLPHLYLAVHQGTLK